MNQPQRYRQPLRRRQRRVRRARLLDKASSQKIFIETMKRHCEEALHEARDRHLKFRDKAKFFFLKGGLDESPSRGRAIEPKKLKVIEPKTSNTGNRADQSESEIPAPHDRILESIEKLDVSMRINQGVSDLIRLARTGDSFIVSKLHGIAVQTIGALYDIAVEHPEVVRTIARGEFSWPALIGRKRFIKQANERLMKVLGLGEGDVFSTRQWQLSAPSTQAALDLFLTAQFFKEDWNLAALTEKNKRTWFEISWDEMLKEGIEPEKIPWLAPVGKSAIGKRSISRGMPDQTAGMKRDDIRAEIKRQVWNAFDKLITGASKKSK